MGKLTEWIGGKLGLSKEARSISLENPATPLSAPADWLFETLSGGFGMDGQIHVNERTAMQLSTVRACVRAISQDVSTVPLNLYSRDSKGNKKLADSRNEFTLLQRRPNPHMTATVLRQAMAANFLLWGNSYGKIDYNGAGKVTAIWPRYPQFVRMELTKNGSLRYIASDPHTGENEVTLSDDMLHFKDLPMDGYAGLYTIRHLKEAVGLGLALQNFGLYYFLNGSRPGGVLEMMGTMTPEAQERVRSSWQHMFAGPRNTNRVAILEEGMKFNPIAINNDNAQYVESRNLQAVEIARMFRVPPHKIGILERSTNNNIEQQALEYVTDCLRPIFVNIEQELNVKLFPGGEFEYEHDVDGLLRGDFASRMAGYAAGRQWGWFSVNDVRRKMNENSIGPEGDIYLTPLNMTDAENDPAPVVTPLPTPKDAEDVAPGKEKPPPPVSKKSIFGRDEIRAYALPIFEDAVRRSINYDRNAQYRKSVSQAFVKVLGLMGRMLGRTADADLVARRYADDLYLRRDEWDGMTTPQIVESEFELACAALATDSVDSEFQQEDSTHEA